MDRRELETLTRRLLAGEASLAAFLDAVCRPATAELPDTTLDLDRQRRCGFPEVVFGENKSAETLVAIAQRLTAEHVPVFITRVAADKADVLRREFPGASYNSTARSFRLDVLDPPPKTGKVTVITAGTSDLPVAEEARETLDWMGVSTVSIHDVGVAGPQRLLAKLPLIVASDAVVVVAGMEAALPSVVGGHVDCPVIGIPTSVGYGASFGGVAALLGMLNSCAANVTVVNIDAGFKGGYIAGLISHGKSKAR